jgi:hypothetical protein
VFCFTKIGENFRIGQALEVLIFLSFPIFPNFSFAESGKTIKKSSNKTTTNFRKMPIYQTPTNDESRHAFLLRAAKSGLQNIKADNPYIT